MVLKHLYFWAITCKSCGGEVGLEPYDDSKPHPPKAQWHRSERVKCPNCFKEHAYSGNEIHVSPSD